MPNSNYYSHKGPYSDLNIFDINQKKLKHLTVIKLLFLIIINRI